MSDSNIRPTAHRQAVAAGANPKVAAAFGRNHLHRGIDRRKDGPAFDLSRSDADAWPLTLRRDQDRERHEIFERGTSSPNGSQATLVAT